MRKKFHTLHIIRPPTYASGKPPSLEKENTSRGEERDYWENNNWFLNANAHQSPTYNLLNSINKSFSLENYFIALKVHRAFDSPSIQAVGNSNGIEKTINSSFSKAQTLQHQWIFIPLHSAFIQQKISINWQKLQIKIKPKTLSLTYK